MLVSNNTSTDYWFGPIHLPGGAVNQSVDDTTATSLYLTDDTVADAINSLYASGKISVSGAATPFPRPTGTPEVLHGDGSPEGIVYAGQGSVFLRRDSGSLYTKKTGVHLNTGWSSIAQGSITTVSAWSGGPPSTPNDQDIWIATDVDSNGTRWQFQYNANSASSYKWEFVGGNWLVAANDTLDTITSSYGDGATAMSVTLTRAGEYNFQHGCEGSTTNGSVQAALKIGSNSESDPASVLWVSDGSTGAQFNNHASRLVAARAVPAVAANDVVKQRYKGTGIGPYVRYRWIAVQPQRIS